MRIRTIFGLIGIALIVGPALPALIQGFILYYQFTFHTITIDECQKKITSVIADLLIPTEYTIYAIFGKYGSYIVGFVLMLYWFFTGEFSKKN